MMEHIRFQDQNVLQQFTPEQQIEHLKAMMQSYGWLIFKIRGNDMMTNTKLELCNFEKEQFDKIRGMIEGMDKMLNLVDDLVEVFERPKQSAKY